MMSIDPRCTCSFKRDYQRIAHDTWCPVRMAEEATQAVLDEMSEEPSKGAQVVHIRDVPSAQDRQVRRYLQALTPTASEVGPPRLPSAHQPGDRVHVVLLVAAVAGTVERVSFSRDGKVRYDVEVLAGLEFGDGPMGSDETILLRDVDSAFVRPIPTDATPQPPEAV